MIIGTWSIWDVEENYETTTTFYSNGTGITLEDDQTEDEGDVFRWSISGRTITITFNDGNSSQMTIKELTNSKLIITGYDEEGNKVSETYIKQ